MILKTKESDVLRACQDYLTLKQIFFWRQNTSGVPIHKGKELVGFRPSPIRGVPDILAIKNGKAFGIECKSSVGKQSDEQKAFQTRFEHAGGTYLLIKSIDELTKFL